MKQTQYYAWIWFFSASPSGATVTRTPPTHNATEKHCVSPNAAAARQNGLTVVPYVAAEATSGRPLHQVDIRPNIWMELNGRAILLCSLWRLAKVHCAADTKSLERSPLARENFGRPVDG